MTRVVLSKSWRNGDRGWGSSRQQPGWSRSDSHGGWAPRRRPPRKPGGARWRRVAPASFSCSGPALAPLPTTTTFRPDNVVRSAGAGGGAGQKRIHPRIAAVALCLAVPDCARLCQAVLWQRRASASCWPPPCSPLQPASACCNPRLPASPVCATKIMAPAGPMPRQVVAGSPLYTPRPIHSRPVRCRCVRPGPVRAYGSKSGPALLAWPLLGIGRATTLFGRPGLGCPIGCPSGPVHT